MSNVSLSLLLKEFIIFKINVKMKKTSVGGISPKKIDDMKLERSDEGEDLIGSKIDDEGVDFD